jgi:hypothetical protein
LVEVRVKTRWKLAVALSVTSALAACDAADDAGDGYGGSASSTGGTTGGINNDGSGEPSVPPEVELEENFRSPVVSGPLLWSANPDSNRVALIDGRTLAVQVIDGGHGPTFLAGLPKGVTSGGALVINVLGLDASVFTLSEDEATSATLVSEERVDLHDGASAWSVGRGGRFAIAWSRSEEGLLGALDGYQDLTVLSFSADGVAATPLSVGFRPTKVVINDAETHAFVVSDPGISVIELTGDEPAVTRELFLPEESEGQPRDVSFTADGSLAFVRLGGTSEVLIVETATDQRVTVTLPEDVTDLDLAGDGSLAVAVMRGAPAPVEGNLGGADPVGDRPSIVALLPVPGIFTAPTVYTTVETPEILGSAVVAPDAGTALLYTNAIESNLLAVLDLEAALDPDAEALRFVDLKAPVQAVFLSEDGKNAVAVMTTPSGSSAGGALALVPVDKALPPRIEGTTTAPRFVSLSGDRALVATWGSTSSRAEAFLGRFPSLSVDRVELPSAPLASGLVPDAGQGFVAQEHPAGRITFVDLESALPRTVTGFELASKVVE